MPLDGTEDGGKPFCFKVQADRVLQQLFPLIRHEVDQNVGGKRKHPVTRQMPEDRGKRQADRRKGEEALDDQDGIQVRQGDRMFHNGGQSPTVDFLISGQFCIERKTVTKQGTRGQLFH